MNCILFFLIDVDIKRVCACTCAYEPQFTIKLTCNYRIITVSVSTNVCVRTFLCRFIQPFHLQEVKLVKVHVYVKRFRLLFSTYFKVLVNDMSYIVEQVMCKRTLNVTENFINIHCYWRQASTLQVKFEYKGLVPEFFVSVYRYYT